MFTILGSDGKEYGPVTIEQVKAWIAEGRANLDTKIKNIGEEGWKRVGELPEFSGNVPPPFTANQGSFNAPVSPTPAYNQRPLANRWIRLVAAILDTIFATICLAPALFMIGAAAVSGSLTGNQGEAEAAVLLAALPLLLIGFLVVLVVQVWLLTTRGQTLGKLLLKIRIVRFDNEANPGFVRAVLLRVIVPAIISCVPLLGSVFGIVDVCFIFRDDHRCIHDLIAGTKVVTA
jgi:uncharacterized RDD family membrane protein YckC